MSRCLYLLLAPIYASNDTSSCRRMHHLYLVAASEWGLQSAACCAALDLQAQRLQIPPDDAPKHPPKHRLPSQSPCCRQQHASPGSRQLREGTTHRQQPGQCQLLCTLVLRAAPTVLLYDRTPSARQSMAVEYGGHENPVQGTAKMATLSFVGYHCMVRLRTGRRSRPATDGTPAHDHAMHFWDLSTCTRPQDSNGARRRTPRRDSVGLWLLTAIPRPSPDRDGCLHRGFGIDIQRARSLLQESSAVVRTRSRIRIQLVGPKNRSLAMCRRSGECTRRCRSWVGYHCDRMCSGSQLRPQTHPRPVLHPPPLVVAWSWSI